MNRTYLDIADADDARIAKEKATKRMKSYLRRAQATEIIAEKLDGVYITKRIIPQIQALIPEAKHIYLDNSWSTCINIVLNYSVQYNDDMINHVTLTQDKDKGNRRIDGKRMVEQAKDDRHYAAKIAAVLAHFDELVDEYNAIATQYAKVAARLDGFLDIPGGRYCFDTWNREDMTMQEFETYMECLASA